MAQVSAPWSPLRHRFDRRRSRPVSCTGVRAHWHARTARLAGPWRRL